MVPVADKAGKTAVVALALYETAAITTRRLPTVSQLCRRRRWVEAALLAVLLVHLHLQDRASPSPVIAVSVIPGRSS